MNKELLQRIKELEKKGLNLDLDRGTFSFKLKSTLQPITFERVSGKFALNEDEQYLYAPFRALSAHPLVGGMFDFSKPGVLEKSYKLLKGQTVYPDHSTSVLAWLGVVCKSWWDNDISETPPGINCTLKINKKWNEKIIDGIKSGAIHSVSVTVFSRFEKSHPELGNDFWFRIGEKVGGKAVRLIATEIISFGEISIVWQGADVYAKRLFDIEVEPESNDSGSEGEKNEKGENKMKLKRSLAVLMGLNLFQYGFGNASEIELDEAGNAMLAKDVAEKFQALTDENKQMKSCLSKVVKEGEGYDDAISRLSQNAEVGMKYRDELVEEVKSLAKLSEGSEELSAVLSKTIENAGIEDLIEFKSEFSRKAEELFPMKCTSCGAEFERGSAMRGDDSSEKTEFNASEYEV